MLLCNLQYLHPLHDNFHLLICITCGKEITSKYADPSLSKRNCSGSSLHLGLGTTVAKAIKKASGGLINPCGGCQQREATLNHHFPAEAQPVSKFYYAPHYPITRNLLFFLFPRKGSEAWKWNCDQLISRKDLFNGTRTVCIVSNPKTTDSLEEVREYLTPLDFHQFIVTPANKPKLKATPFFIPLLSSLAPDSAADFSSPNHIDQKYPSPTNITFFCHSKGVRHFPTKINPNHPVFNWTKLQYDICLDHPQLVLSSLYSHAFTGAFKRYGHYKSRWDYAGAFYWFRTRDIFLRNWRYIDPRWFGYESWPGHLVNHEESSCLFLDNCQDLYDPTYWTSTVLPSYETWKTNPQYTSAYP
jgi:hypothetical protein